MHPPCVEYVKNIVRDYWTLTHIKWVQVADLLWHNTALSNRNGSSRLKHLYSYTIARRNITAQQLWLFSCGTKFEPCRIHKNSGLRGKITQVPSNAKLDTFVIFCLLVLPIAPEIMKILLLEKGFNYIPSNEMSCLSESYVFDILTPCWLQDVLSRPGICSARTFYLQD